MRKVPFLYLPLMAFPSAAMAYGAPPGFDDFEPIHQQGEFLQNMIEINKSCIIFFQEALSHIGFESSSAGLSIIIWAAFLKVLTTPAYENSLKYPAQMEKAVQDVIED